MAKRVILVVMDSVGIGEAPDSAFYGDEGSDTLGNTAKAVGGLHVPNMQKLGLGNIRPLPIEGVDRVELPAGAFGRMQEASKGKDTTTGHWEMMGILSLTPFPTYPKAFPPSLVKELEQALETKFLGNEVASGTEIMARLGEEHMKCGYPILYTSADSVLQLAAHEKVIPLEKLYDLCRKARQVMQGENAVGRIIARPFVGKPGEFVRTPNRHDFSLSPGFMILRAIQESGHTVASVGKIFDIFAGEGIDISRPTKGNRDGMEKLAGLLDEVPEGMIFVNLVDFDQSYGHRNDAEGYAHAIEEWDAFLPQVLERMTEEDILFITADHGCDPTTPSTDHSREYVPLLVYGKPVKAGVDLHIRSTFADLGKTIADYLGIEAGNLPGTSFWPEMRNV